MPAKHRQPSQSERIAAWLRRGRSLTPLRALDLFNCMRLGARVLELKRAGMTIESQKVKTPGGAWVARYRIPKPSASPRLRVSPSNP